MPTFRNPVLIDPAELVNGLLALRGGVTADENPVGEFEVMDGSSLGQKFRVRQNL